MRSRSGGLAENWAICPVSCHPRCMTIVRARDDTHGRRPAWPLPGAAVLVALGAAALGCRGAKEAPKLAKTVAAPRDLSSVPVPPADGPRLGATADITPVLARPEPKAEQLGYLHAGATVARAAEPIATEGCAGGWYPVRPRGFVCAGQGATLDLSHPTLIAMSLQPKLDQELPYAYARASQKSTLFAMDPQRDAGIQPLEPLAVRSGMAVVGSWSALDPEGKTQRLGMLTNGRFVPADDLERADSSAFTGVALDGEKTTLPLAFVVRRGIHTFDLDGMTAKQKGELEYHETVRLTGRYRTIGDVRFWALPSGRWVRHRDVTVVRRREVFPDFAAGDQKWLDISVVTGTCVLYEGKRAVFVTLASVGTDRLGDPQTSQSTARGTFNVVGKHITATGINPDSFGEPFRVYDAPWALELSSGQMIHGAYWHDRFGVEAGPGNIQLSPPDAHRVWAWAAPELPEGWHGVSQPPPSSPTVVVIRS
jgi:hypothetical protein